MPMDSVKNQYKTSENLNMRISIHAKYSTNKQPFGDWIVSHYDLHPGDQILELGCGTGELWKDQLSRLSPDMSLTLTDFSPGMLESARQNLPRFPNIRYQVVDIQEIPYPDQSFDVVIANMMLYHVPDLTRALKEVRRVLKDGGRFYCATFGIRGINEYICDLLQDLQVSGDITHKFTLQNGEALLIPHFSAVTRLDREDSLAITDTEDFADYIYSLSSLSNISCVPRNTLLSLLNSRVKDGILSVPKEYGMFICKK